MKVNKEMAYASFESTAIEKTARQLMRQGFTVIKDYRFVKDGRRVVLDLFAENGLDRRIYEFKISENKISKPQYEMLQAIAQTLEARLYVVYLEKPKSISVNFEGLEKIICDDINSKPQSIFDNLEQQKSIEHIQEVNISSLSIKDSIVKVEGSASAVINGWEDASLEEKDFSLADFKFRLTYDISKEKVYRSYYRIDQGFFEQYYSENK